jgi:hypothetical protein
MLMERHNSLLILLLCRCYFTVRLLRMENLFWLGKDQLKLGSHHLLVGAQQTTLLNSQDPAKVGCCLRHAERRGKEGARG